MEKQFVAKLKTHSPFYGKMYSTAVSPECEVFGHGKLMTSIEYSLNKCGIYKNTEGSFIGNLVVQQHPLIQKRGDAAFRLVCTFPEVNRTLAHTIGFEKESESRLVEASAIPSPILGIAYSVINSTAKSPTVTLRITDNHGNDVTGVTLGDELNLKIEVDADSAYGIFARDLVAKSGTNDEELILLDSRGCPEDPAIFPHLRKEDRALKGRFEAFKFTNDAVVRFQVYLQFCRHECQPIRCDGELSHGRRRREEKDSNLDKDKYEFVELQKEIIVTGPSKNRVSKNTGKPALDQTTATPDNETLICGPKNLLIATIIGICVVQVLIVLCCAICLCHRSKDRLLTEPTYRTSDLYYARPSTIFNTLRSMRTNLRD